MSIWIVCTYLSFNIFENLIKKDNIYLSSTIIFAISTAYLISIRVTGVLILIQYLISLSIYISTSNINIQKFLIKFYSRILFFLISFLFFIYLFYPLYWLDPLKFVSEHYQWLVEETFHNYGSQYIQKQGDLLSFNINSMLICN